MKRYAVSVSLLAASLVLAGCSTSGLLNRARGPSSVDVQTGPTLSMPPDLQLPPPGSGTASAYQPPAASTAATENGVYGSASAANRPSSFTRRGGGTQCTNGTTAPDIYGCYNISKVKADGTQKTPGELQMELRNAIIAEKRRANPGYGTVRNIGELFN